MIQLLSFCVETHFDIRVDGACDVAMPFASIAAIGLLDDEFVTTSSGASGVNVGRDTLASTLTTMKI